MRFFYSSLYGAQLKIVGNKNKYTWKTSTKLKYCHNKITYYIFVSKPPPINTRTGVGPQSKVFLHSNISLYFIK